MPQQLLLGIEHIGDTVGTQRISRDQGLRNGALRFFLGQAAQVGRHRIDAGGVELQFQRVSLRQPRKHIVNDFAQPVTIGQWKIEVLHQRSQFRRHHDLRRGKNHSPPVSGKFLPYIPQSPHYDRIVHVTVKILQYENGFEGHRLHVGQRLHRFARVVDRAAARHRAVGILGQGYGSGHSLRIRGARLQRASHLRNGAPGLGPDRVLVVVGLRGYFLIVGQFLRSRAYEPVGDAPFEGRDFEIATRRAHKVDGAHLLRRLHHDDGSRRVDEYFEAIESVCHK